MKRLFLKLCTALLTLIFLFPLAAVVMPVSAISSSKKPLEGKTISILGDSISTFENYSNGSAADTSNSTVRNNLAYYTQSNYSSFSLSSVNDTWWKQAADISGAQILVNNSWSASMFSASRWGGSIPAAYVDRCVQLHDDTGSNAGIEPDIIAVFMGTNDFHVARRAEDGDNAGVTLGSEVNYESLYSNGKHKTPSNTAEAYAIMLDKITKRYVNAEIYCFTLLKSQAINAGPSPYPTATDGDIAALEKFNTSIKSVAQHYGAYVVDLYENAGITEKTSNNIGFPHNNTAHLANYVHPNNFGMDAITGCFLSTVYANSKLMPQDADVYTVEYKTNKGIFKQGTPTAVLGGEFTLDIFEEAKTDCSNLKITMGGVDITSSCKTDKKISITNVTGDIVISDPDYKEPVDDSHECNFVEDRIINLTCTQRGTQILKCTVCGEEKIGKAILPEGHKYDGDDDTECNVCKEHRNLEHQENETRPEEVDSETDATEKGCGSSLSFSIVLITSLAFAVGITVNRKKF